jgi:polar amino acid transport system substrate-binding protein
MKIKSLLFSLLLLIPNTGFCQKELKVAYGNALAPWVIPDENRGILIDLMTATMEPVGYKIVPLYLPYLRRINGYKSNLVDVSSDINSNTTKAENLIGHFSGTVYEYKNYLISLSENNLALNTLEDVGQRSLISWQGAKEHLGKYYKNLMDKNPNYRENHDQTFQVKALFLKRFQIAQMDLQIFKYYRNLIQKAGQIDTTLKVDLFPVLGASPNGFLFKDEKVRDLFVERIKQLKASGEFQKIFDKYTVEVLNQP